MGAAWVIAGHALRESVRRRVFAVVLGLSAAFLGLFAFGTAEVFATARFGAPSGVRGLDAHGLIADTLLGLGMFGTLFLGTVLAVFLTLNAVRGDAERGLLQPLVVRPVGRTALLGARLGAAAGVCAAYVLVMYGAVVAIVHVAGGRWPDRLAGPGLALAAAVVVVVALSILGSVFLSSTANGIAVFMIFGGGLVAGVMSSIGDALDSGSLREIAHAISIALPFEALYQAGLHALTADATGLGGAILRLGPFGASHAGGAGLVAWSAAYVAGVSALAMAAFARRDL